MLLTTTVSGCNVGGVGFVVFIFGFLASPAGVRRGGGETEGTVIPFGQSTTLAVACRKRVNIEMDF